MPDPGYCLENLMLKNGLRLKCIYKKALFYIHLRHPVPSPKFPKEYSPSRRGSNLPCPGTPSPNTQILAWQHTLFNTYPLHNSILLVVSLQQDFPQSCPHTLSSETISHHCSSQTQTESEHASPIQTLHQDLITFWFFGANLPMVGMAPNLSLVVWPVRSKQGSSKWSEQSTARNPGIQFFRPVTGIHFCRILGFFGKLESRISVEIAAFLVNIFP